jgi:hypothetical protein
MELHQVEIGKRYTYSPPKECKDDNLHFPAVVEAVAKRVRVRIFMEGKPGGVLRSVSAKRLTIQEELI